MKPRCGAVIRSILTAVRQYPWVPCAATRPVALRCACVTLGLLLGCGVIREQSESKPSELAIVGKPMPPEKAKEVLSELGQNFAYGPGLGDAALNIGTAVVFPPYAIYLLGNVLLSVSGYEPVTVASLLPQEQGQAWSNTYDSVVSGPGKVVAAMAGREYRSRDVADQKMQAVLQSIESQDAVKAHTQTPEQASDLGSPERESNAERKQTNK